MRGENKEEGRFQRRICPQRPRAGADRRAAGHRSPQRSMEGDVALAERPGGAGWAGCPKVLEGPGPRAKHPKGPERLGPKGLRHKAPPNVKNIMILNFI